VGIACKIRLFDTCRVFGIGGINTE